MNRVRAFVLAVTALLVLSSTAGAKVLLVGSYHGIRGHYTSVQAAVNAARSGDWVLVGPGDYKTSNSRAPSDASDRQAGVLITTPDLRLRGMNRNTVIVDGTSRARRCAAAVRPSRTLAPRAPTDPSA
jgi:hypothetical protein